MSLPTRIPPAGWRSFGFAVALATALFPSGLAWSDENSDLDKIPDSVQQAEESPTAPVQPANPRHREFVENAVGSYSWRSVVVPPPSSAQPMWQERLSFDAREEWIPTSHLHLFYSGRLNVFAQDDILFPSEQTLRHDFREGYGSWEALPQNFVDAGRINLKSGVAVGFNPTDFFKTRAVVDRTSLDPSVLRENRLGTLMLRSQSLWEGGSMTLAFAPSLYDEHAIYDSDKLSSFDPMFQRTNARQRFLLKTNVDVSKEFSPEFLFYQENTRTTYGLNLTYGIGNKIVVYAEWAGGDRASLKEEAYRFGQETGTLPAIAPRVLQGNRDAGFMQDAAVGASYSTETKITTYLEYDYHEAGFSRDDWRNWFALGEANRNVVPITGQLWYIRSYAQDQQEPMARESAVLRVSWTDAFVPNLELTGLIITNLYDESSLIQASVNYYLSNQWTFGALALVNAGTERTEKGSLTQESSFLVKAIRYF